MASAPPKAVSAPETHQTSRTSKIEQSRPAPTFGFDLGRALKSLVGRSLPGNMAYLRVSKRFLDQQVSNEYRGQNPVSDCILGTLSQGTSEITGRTRLVLIPNDHQALIELHFTGSTRFRTSGRSGPVRLYSHGTTWFDSTKRLSLDGHGAHLTPASTHSTSSYLTDNITTSLPRLLGRISLHVAWRREGKSHSQASAVISRNSSRDIGHGFDVSMAERLAGATKLVTEQIDQLPKDHPLIAHGMHCHTTVDGVYVVLLGPGAAEQKFVPAPTLDKNGPDVELHVHSSLVVKVISDPELRRMLQSSADSLLAKQTPSASQEPSPDHGAKQFDAYWSSDGSWLTLIWNAARGAAGTEPPQAAKGSRKNNLQNSNRFMSS